MKDESEYDTVDVHGQYIFNFHHQAIEAGTEPEMLERAFKRDFEVNGPSTVRIVRTTLAGWKRYKNHGDARVRRRFAKEAESLAFTFTGLVAGAKKYYKNDPPMRAKMSALLKDLRREFGLKSWFASLVGGFYVAWSLRKEAKRLAEGWTYEPPTFYESNAACAGSNGTDPVGARPCTVALARAAAPAAL